ncbi:MAG: hypothetical protein QY322_03815 [bacterium]|nr:MAG: hypothetical protein QY322_03815 [bacterium]
MKKITKIFAFLLVPGAYFLMPNPAHAVCPICTVAVAGGLGVSRYFGIDDSLLGVWAGGLVVSVSLWTADWLSKRSWGLLKKSNNTINTVASLIFWTLLTYVPLYSANIIGHPFNTILGIDKLVFGSILGFVAFMLGVYLDKRVREVKGKQLFNFQKVVFPVLSLTIFTLVLYFWGGYLYNI